jgi:YggT family protein
VGLIATIFDYLIRILMLLVIVYVVLSYFMDPYHPFRRRVGGWVEPLLAPIRRVLPPIGNLDLSPLVLIVILQLLNIIIQSILR